MKTYAGIGSRRTPADVLALMHQIARRFAIAGWALNSGGAPGADLAFERGCDEAGGARTTYIPWDGFNGKFRRNDPWASLGNHPLRAMEIASQFHPAWEKCSPAARKLHARNSYQVLGMSLDNPVRLVVCWTPGGTGTGGTGQTLRIARAHHIKIHDLAISRIRAEYERRMDA